MMKAWIEANLYHPSVVLPLVTLTQLMVAHDFNLGQVGLIVAAKGAQAAVSHSRDLVDAWHDGAHA
ncbi:conserved protein of unknown function [Burkholderia multivorans]